MTRSRPRNARPVGKLIADAKRAAGDHAVAAAERQDYVKAHEWTKLAVALDALLRDAVELLADG